MAWPTRSYRVLVEAPGFAAPRPDDPHRRRRWRRSTCSCASRRTPRPSSSRPRRCRGPCSESPASTTVVGRRRTSKARQLENVADALRTTPGFAVGRNGGRGALTSVFPRGGESDYTLVLVDGIRVNSFGGGFDFSLLPLGDVEQVEIVRGPQSAVFGADAIGGVVHLTTRQGGPPTASGQIEGGGQATRAGARRHARRGRRVVVRRQRRSATRATASRASPRPPARPCPTTTGSSRWRRDTWSGRKSATTAVRADFRWIDAERGNPGPYGSNPIGAYTAVDRVSRGEDTQRQLGLHGRLPWGSVLAGRIQQRWQVTVADLDNRYHSSFGDSFFETRRVTARTQTDVVLTPTTGLTAGVEGFGERARSTYITGEQFQEVPIERRTFGGFGEVRQDLGARASVSAGVRADAIRRNALEGDPNPFGPRPAFADESVTSVNPRLAGRFVAWQDQRRRRADDGACQLRHGHPAARRLRDRVHRQPGRSKPERSRSVDIGVSHVLVPQLTVDATAFFNRYDDLIVAVGGSFADASRYRTDNISNARARGLELEGAWRGPHGVHARAGLHVPVDGDSRRRSVRPARRRRSRWATR